MALAGESIPATETELLASVGVDRRPPIFEGGRLAAWGDPYQAFVGDPDGSPPALTGYGVYSEPIARAALAVGAAVSRHGSGIPATELYEAVLRGHASVAWIANTYSNQPLGTWIAFDGHPIPYTFAEHAVTVVGVDGDRVLINDPWFGAAWHPKSQFEAAYATFDGMAVILSAADQPGGGRVEAVRRRADASVEVIS